MSNSEELQVVPKLAGPKRALLGDGDDGCVVDPSRKKRPSCQPLQSLLLLQLVLIVGKVSDGVPNRLEAADTETEHPHPHRLAGLLVLDLGKPEAGLLR